MTTPRTPATERLTRDVPAIDAEQVANEIVTALRSIVGGELRRRGAVVGVSDGIDSSVTAALYASTFGPDRTLGLLIPRPIRTVTRST